MTSVFFSNIRSLFCPFNSILAPFSNLWISLVTAKQLIEKPSKIAQAQPWLEAYFVLRNALWWKTGNHNGTCITQSFRFSNFERRKRISRSISVLMMIGSRSLWSSWQTSCSLTWHHYYFLSRKRILQLHQYGFPNLITSTWQTLCPLCQRPQGLTITCPIRSSHSSDSYVHSSHYPFLWNAQIQIQTLQDALQVNHFIVFCLKTVFSLFLFQLCSKFFNASSKWKWNDRKQ